MTPPKVQRRMVSRRRELIAAHHSPHKAAAIVAKEFGVCRATVYNIVRRRKRT